jgi:hypothetical protein
LGVCASATRWLTEFATNRFRGLLNANSSRYLSRLAAYTGGIIATAVCVVQAGLLVGEVCLVHNLRERPCFAAARLEKKLKRENN